MSLHRIEFEYVLPEFGMLEMEIEESLEQLEKEEIALAEIKETYVDIEDIVITNVKAV